MLKEDSLFFVCTGIIDPVENCTGSRLLVFVCWEVRVAVQVWSLENLKFFDCSTVKSSDIQGRTHGFSWAVLDTKIISVRIILLF